MRGILPLSLALAAFVIYQLDDSHYGRRGAIRWGVAGTLYGLSQQVILTPIPADFDFTAASILRQIGGDLLWKGLALVFSYLLAFHLVSLILELRGRTRKG